jgi:hypothetical protein
LDAEFFILNIVRLPQFDLVSFDIHNMNKLAVIIGPNGPTLEWVFVKLL